MHGIRDITRAPLSAVRTTVLALTTVAIVARLTDPLHGGLGVVTPFTGGLRSARAATERTGHRQGGTSLLGPSRGSRDEDGRLGGHCCDKLRRRAGECAMVMSMRGAPSNRHPCRS